MKTVYLGLDGEAFQHTTTALEPYYLEAILEEDGRIHKLWMITANRVRLKKDSLSGWHGEYPPGRWLPVELIHPDMQIDSEF